MLKEEEIMLILSMEKDFTSYILRKMQVDMTSN